MAVKHQFRAYVVQAAMLYLEAKRKGMGIRKTEGALLRVAGLYDAAIENLGGNTSEIRTDVPRY